VTHFLSPQLITHIESRSSIHLFCLVPTGCHLSYRVITTVVGLPPATLTPGEMDASLACVSNADRSRAVSDSEKNQILAEYGWPSNTKKSSGEFAHWLPHWMGGWDVKQSACG
jgi:hypothetical protein